MAQIYGELIRAQLQSSATDLSPTATGLVYFNTSTGLKWHTGSGWKIAADLDSSQTLAGKTLDATCSINVSALPVVSLAKGGLGADASAWSGFLKISAGVASATSIAASDLPIVTAAKGGLGADASAFTGVVKSSSGVFSASTVVNSDVSASAAIAGTKISPAFGSQNITTTGTSSVASELISGTGGNGFIEMAGQASNPSAPSTGVVKVFAKNDSKVYKIDSLGNVSEIGSGSGSGINYLADYFLSDVYCNSATSDNVTNYTSYTGNDTTPSKFAIRTTTPGTLVQNTSSLLRGANSYLFTPNGSGTFMAWPTFTLQQPDIGKAVSVSFDLVNNGVDGDFDVVVQRYNSSGTYQETIPVAGNASSGTPASAKLPIGTKSFNGFFISSGTLTDRYRLMIRRLTAGTTTIAVDTVVVGPNQVLQGAIVTDWQTYSPAVVGMGTINSQTARYRRVGSNLEVLTSFGAGTVDGQDFTIDLPTGLTHIYTSNDQLLTGSCVTSYAGAAQGGIFPLAIAGTTTKIYWTHNNSRAGTTKLAANTIAVNSSTVRCSFMVPIAEWQSNTQQAARAVEEYASYNGTTTVYGPLGSPFPSPTLGTGITLTNSWQTPYLPTDSVFVEVDRGTSGAYWYPAWQDFPYISASTKQYGLGSATPTATSYGVYFGDGGPRPGSNAFGSNGSQAWGSFGWRYRVRKVSSGAAVGFPVGARNVVADSSVSTVPSGVIGWSQTTNVTVNQNCGSSGTWWDARSINFSGKPGKYLVYGAIHYKRNAATFTEFYAYAGWSTNTGNVSTGLNTGDNMWGHDLQNLTTNWTAQSVHACPAVVITDSTGTITSINGTAFSGTTLYLKGFTGTYTAGTPVYNAEMHAVLIA